MGSKISLSNEQLFRAYTAGNQEALSQIINNFDNFIRARAAILLAANRETGIEFSELEFVGKSAFYAALKSYRGDASPFAAYVTVVIFNAMRNHMMRLNNPTETKLRNSISLDGNRQNDETNLLISDSITEVSDEDYGYYKPHPISYFEDTLEGDITELEMKVLKSRLEGYSLKEIAEKHSLSKRKLDAIIEQIKAKGKWPNK